MFENLKTVFYQERNKVSEKMQQRVQDCKTKNNLNNCKECSDYKICTIRKYEK